MLGLDRKKKNVLTPEYKENQAPHLRTAWNYQQNSRNLRKQGKVRHYRSHDEIFLFICVSTSWKIPINTPIVQAIASLLLTCTGSVVHLYGGEFAAAYHLSPRAYQDLLPMQYDSMTKTSNQKVTKLPKQGHWLISAKCRIEGKVGYVSSSVAQKTRLLHLQITKLLANVTASESLSRYSEYSE